MGHAVSGSHTHPWLAGGDAAEVQRRRLKEERDHHPFPGDSDRHSSPDRGAQQQKHQAVSGEQRSGRKTQVPHYTIRPARGGTEQTTHTHTHLKSRYSEALNIFSFSAPDRLEFRFIWCTLLMKTTRTCDHTSFAIFSLVLFLLDTVVQPILFERKIKFLPVWKRLINPLKCRTEPGKGFQAQRPEGETAGNQAGAGEPNPEGDRGEAQAGERTCTSHLLYPPIFEW